MKIKLRYDPRKEQYVEERDKFLASLKAAPDARRSQGEMKDKRTIDCRCNNNTFTIYPSEKTPCLVMTCCNCGRKTLWDTTVKHWNNYE